MFMWMAVDCATIIHGTDQAIDVNSAPDNAEVWVDGARIGMTPTRLSLKRKDSHIIKVVKEGYTPLEVRIDTKASAWLVGNIVFGGIPGSIIDIVTGGINDLSPERIDVNLSKLQGMNGKTIYVTPEQLERVEQIRLTNNRNEILCSVELTWTE